MKFVDKRIGVPKVPLLLADVGIAVVDCPLFDSGELTDLDPADPDLDPADPDPNPADPDPLTIEVFKFSPLLADVFTDGVLELSLTARPSPLLSWLSLP